MWFKPQDILALSPGEGPGDKFMFVDLFHELGGGACM